MEVHNTLKEHRIAANETQEGLAKALGVSRQTIISMEKGNYVPSVLLALKCARFFGVAVEKIFSLHK